MEFLKTFEQATAYNKDFDFISYCDLASGIYGAPNISVGSLDKLLDLSPLLNENDGESEKFLIDSNSQSSGIRLIFKTDSPEIVLKTQLSRTWAHQNIIMFCSSGFDIYQVKNGKQIHKTVVSPEESFGVFTHKLSLEPNLETVIYFPTFNKVINFEIGIKKGCSIEAVTDFYSGNPVVFYGNSCTQGASASRSGNAYPNIVSRKMSRDIINYSFSGACRAELSMAKILADTKMSALIIDYTRNACSFNEFCKRFEPFYRTIKERQPNLPVIILNAFGVTFFDKHIKEVLERIKKEFHSTFYIDLNLLFKDVNKNALSADNIHYTDVGMYLVADKIIEYLNQVI